MSSDPAILLRMLEPVIRPGQTGGTSAKAPSAVPFEQQAFEDLLQEAGQEKMGSASQEGSATKGDVKAASPDPLALLADFSRMENVSVREQFQITRSSETGSAVSREDTIH